MSALKANVQVTVNSRRHRAHGKVGTVVSAAPGLFLGTWQVLVDGVEYAFIPSELEPFTREVHYCNYLRYKAKQDALPREFTASQQRTPLQYLPYARYPATN